MGCEHFVDLEADTKLSHRLTMPMPRAKTGYPAGYQASQFASNSQTTSPRNFASHSPTGSPREIRAGPRHVYSRTSPASGELSAEYQSLPVGGIRPQADGLRRFKEAVAQKKQDSEVSSRKVEKVRTEDGHVHIGGYEMGNNLGEGDFSKVVLAKKLDTGAFFAIKVLKPILLSKKREVVSQNGKMAFRSYWDQVRDEVNIIRDLDHPNVVKVYKFEILPKTKF